MERGLHLLANSSLIWPALTATGRYSEVFSIFTTEFALILADGIERASHHETIACTVFWSGHSPEHDINPGFFVSRSICDSCGWTGLPTRLLDDQLQWNVGGADV